MRAALLRPARRRACAVMLLAAGLTLIAHPAAADPRGDVRRAKQALNNAQSYASAADQALARARAELTAIAGQLAALQQRVAALDARISADQATYAQVQQAQSALTQQRARLAQWLLDAQRKKRVFRPIPGSTFTVDTDLTQPSGETAANIDGFLQSTAMAGLGASFMKAEQTYHVSARYFVAHAILESAWGTSAIAQDKHNLFGFNADDRNPYQDASTFPSFDACIQYVARFIATNYLSPSGRYYHGPTLRGMNVDYASDPNWADKIAAIAVTIP